MAATGTYSVTMVLRKETAFPLCRAVERKECCLPGVFSDSGDTPANHLCELNGQCVCGKWVEDVCVLANMEYLSISFCAVLWAAAPDLVAVLPM